MAKNKPIEIEVLKAGTHRSSDGRECKFSVDDLNEIAQTYNPSVFRAPIIVSHNTYGVKDAVIANSELAHGFPSSLKVVGDRLIALCEKVSPTFKQCVKNNQLLSFSSSLYLRDSPSNPSPGKLALRHIAALGASPPAIKGLKPLSLTEGIDFSGMGNDVGIVSFECPCLQKGNSMEPIAALLRGMREYLIESRDLSTADAILPADTIDAISTTQSEQMIQALLSQVADLSTRVTALESEETAEEPDEMTSEMPAETAFSEEINWLKQQLESEKANVQKLLLSAKTEKIASFVERMRLDGRLLPHQIDSKEIEFNETKESISLQDFMMGLNDKQLVFFQEWVKGTPSKINYSELSWDDGLIDSRQPVKSNIPFDQTSQLLDAKIRAFQEHNPGLSYVEAATKLGVK